ncbi:rsbT co-antagonist protein RsbR [Saccharothrix carnea]|uniref:RsbT co-antagonist protein RsbR n=1 Tax=Saccharothrix carnea TaxID=1280637 RepID=A0A2P8I0R3_SACCR|nr:STAS domain-containing protein [Saccharothrix carnea]PSL52060.1 rsbT co-antagonist protein RsbR [Saccharothrix carnea]
MATEDDLKVRDLLVRVLREHDAEILDLWVRAQSERAAVTALGERELRSEAAGVIAALREGLETGLPVGDVVERHAPAREAVVRLSVRRARAGVDPTATALATLALKDTLLDVLREHTDEPGALFSAAITVNRLLDAAGALTFASYVEGREEIIRTQHRQMLELSTPVVRLWRGVLAVPLIGTLDSARTQLVMNGLLEAIQADEAPVAIIDITGVPTVDTVVAHHLLQTVTAVRLMGAECFISGIRPAIAQTITQLGIDLSTITTRATLADALAEAVRLLDADFPDMASERVRSAL